MQRRSCHFLAARPIASPGPAGYRNLETLIGSRGIAPSDGEADSVAGGTGGLKPRSSAGGSILTGAFNEKSLRPGLGKRFVKMPRAVLIPGIISRSERRPG